MMEDKEQTGTKWGGAGRVWFCLLFVRAESLYVEINYVFVLNVLYQASVFGNIFCVLREEALRSLIC